MGEHGQVEDSYPELFPKDFGQRLERLMEITGMSWEEFAERLGVESDGVAYGDDPDRRRGLAHHAAGVVGPQRHGSDASRSR